MAMRALREPDYSGMAGVMAVRSLQQALVRALQAEDWDRVRKLDQTCVVLIDKVIAANRDDGTSLAMALGELKGVYANLIIQCKREVASMAH
jgi:flagellar protein FliT